MADEIKGLFKEDALPAGGTSQNPKWLDQAFYDAAHSSVFNKTVDPTVNDDNTQGFFVGAVWINTTSDKFFVCLDITTGAAVWLGVPGIDKVSTSPMTFVLSGNLAAGVKLDGVRIISISSVITKVQVFRGTAGNSGSTIVDVNKGVSGGPFTTLYTTQANRPTITPANGADYLLTATLPNIVALNANNIITVDLDQTEVGGAKDLVVAIFTRPA